MQPSLTFRFVSGVITIEAEGGEAVGRMVGRRSEMQLSAADGKDGAIQLTRFDAAGTEATCTLIAPWIDVVNFVADVEVLHREVATGRPMVESNDEGHEDLLGWEFTGRVKDVPFEFKCGFHGPGEFSTPEAAKVNDWLSRWHDVLAVNAVHQASRDQVVRSAGPQRRDDTMAGTGRAVSETTVFAAPSTDRSPNSLQRAWRKLANRFQVWRKRQ